MIRPHPRVAPTKTTGAVSRGHCDGLPEGAEILRLIRERDLEVLCSTGDPSELRELASSVESFVEQVLNAMRECTWG